MCVCVLIVYIAHKFNANDEREINLMDLKWQMLPVPVLVPAYRFMQIISVFMHIEYDVRSARVRV